MVSFESQYTGNLRTMVEHLSSSQKLITDAPLDNNGMGASFSPTDLVAGALGSCMATVMGIYARKFGIDLDGLKWDTEKTMTSQPRRIDCIKIRFTWEQPLGSKQQLDELKEIALKCPVALSLDPKIQQEIQFDF